MKKTIADKLDYADQFYRQPCWLELWRKTCDPCRLTFWSRIDETNAATLNFLLGSSRIPHSCQKSHSISSAFDVLFTA